MIVLSVISFNGAPASPLEASFDELGGSIGRSETNQLVLPDSERTVSRVHAQVVWRNGVYALIDRGSNAISVNGRALGNGREMPIAAGDQVQIGGYLLRVQAGTAPPADDPFGDLFADARPAAAPARPPASRPPPQTSASPAAPTEMPRAPPAAAAPGMMIPDDWEPLAPRAAPMAPMAPIAPISPISPMPPIAPVATPTPVRMAPQASSGLTELLSPGARVGAHTPAPTVGTLFDGAAARTIDDLIGGLGGGSAPSAGAHRPPPPGPGRGVEADLIDLLNPAPDRPFSASDHHPELNLPWMAPAAQVPPSPPSAPASIPAAPVADPQGAVFSWDAPAREPRAATPAPAQAPASAPDARRPPPQIIPPTTFGLPVRAGAAAAAPTPAPTPAAAAPLAAALDLDALLGASAGAMPAASAASAAPLASAASAAPAASAGGFSTADSEALLAAFMQGLQMPGLRDAAITPESMRLIGSLLREATRGAVELLRARAAVKGEMGAMRTTIAPRANNPLKFSPSAEAALQHLLGPPVAGFQRPEQAMRDAFDDLRAHELAVMAGMRAALAGVLQRFDPQRLEGQIAKASGLSALIPATRRARLWEQFQALYAQISTEAAEDFQRLFGDAFLQAYEDQLDRMAGESD